MIPLASSLLLCTRSESSLAIMSNSKGAMSSMLPPGYVQWYRSLFTPLSVNQTLSESAESTSAFCFSPFNLMKYSQEHIYFLSSAHISSLKKKKTQFNLPDYSLAYQLRCLCELPTTAYWKPYVAVRPLRKIWLHSPHVNTWLLVGAWLPSVYRCWWQIAHSFLPPGRTDVTDVVSAFSAVSARLSLWQEDVAVPLG